MNWVDLSLIGVLLLAVWAGWKKGFIRGSLGLLGWAGSIAAGLFCYPYTAKLITRFTTLDAWLLPVSFILTTVLALILSVIITKRIAQVVPEKVNNNLVNRFLGIIPGLVNGLILAALCAAVLLAMPVKNRITNEARNSRIAMTLSSKAQWANKKLAPVFDEAARQTMSQLNVSPEAHETVNLHFTYENPAIRPGLEARMLEMINEERAKEGLKPLKADREMTLVARVHSKDMFSRGYFSHDNPDGKDPFDRMRAARVKFKTAGENLALAQTLELAHTNLMNSPGHRANIMNPDFGRAGIGILDGGFYGLMISQEFRD
ncbi:MAG: CvpA family protein [Chitinophagaceae bacterium]|nr:CvpA family protein [Chitinophagaceae bacterium]